MYSEALPVHQRSHEIWKAKFGLHHPYTIKSLTKLADCFVSEGRTSEALPLYLSFLDIQELDPDQETPSLDLETAPSVVLHKLASRFDDKRFDSLGNTTDMAASFVFIFQKALTMHENVFGAHHLHTVRCMVNLATVYDKIKRHLEAVTLLRQALSELETVLGPDDLDCAGVMHSLADNLVSFAVEINCDANTSHSQVKCLLAVSPEIKEAVKLHKNSLKIRETKFGPMHLETAKSLNCLGQLFEMSNRPAEGLAVGQQALAIFEESLGPNDSTTASCLVIVLSCLNALERYGQALPLQMRILTEHQQTFGSTHMKTSESHSDLAIIYVKLGMTAEALEHFQKTFEIRSTVLGLTHESTETSLQDIISLSVSKSMSERAFTILERALEDSEARFGRNHQDMVPNLSLIAKFYNVLGKHSQALLLLQRALIILEIQLGKKHIGILGALRNLARGYTFLGRTDDVVLLGGRALGIVEDKSRSVLTLETATILKDLAQLLSSHLRLKEAVSLYQRALKIIKQKLGTDSLEAADIMSSLGVYLDALGQPAKALPMHERALAINEAKQAPDHFSILISLKNLSWHFYHTARPHLALPFSSRAFGIVEARFGYSRGQDSGITVHSYAQGSEQAEMANRISAMIAATLFCHASVLQALDFPDADQLFERSLAIQAELIQAKGSSGGSSVQAEFAEEVYSIIPKLPIELQRAISKDPARLLQLIQHFAA